MRVIDVLVPLLGAALLLLLAFDILITVFHPEGHGGPVNRFQNRVIWAVFRRLGVGRDGEPSHTFLSFCGPVLAVQTFITWALLLIGGFALIFYPGIEAFPVSPGASDTPWVKTLYYSGYVASTLGIGDVAPSSPVYRILTVVEALGGFALFTMSVSYVLAVYRELGIATALAMELDGYFSHGTGRVLAMGTEGGYDALDEWIDRTTSNLLRITQSHSQYPVIHYFHAGRPSRSLMVQLTHLIDLVETTARPDAPEPVRRLSHRPAFHALRSAVTAHVDEVSRSVVPDDYDPAYRDPDRVPLSARHDRLMRYMLTVRRDPDRGSPTLPADR